MVKLQAQADEYEEILASIGNIGKAPKV
ncbi:MAG: hypothetical protein RL675_927, partial [Bacteroidota bacterium]